MLSSKWNIWMLCVNILKEQRGRRFLLKNNKRIVNIASVKYGVKSGGQSANPFYSWNDMKIFARVEDKGRPIPNPPTCLNDWPLNIIKKLLTAKVQKVWNHFRQKLWKVDAGFGNKKNCNNVYSFRKRHHQQQICGTPKVFTGPFWSYIRF